MSLRIIIQPHTIAHWITERRGLPARKRGTDADLRILFDGPVADCDTLSPDEFATAVRLTGQTLLVDDEPGKTFHKFVPRT